MIANASVSVAITKVKVELSPNGSAYVEHPMMGVALGGLATSETKALHLGGLPYSHVRITCYTASSTAGFSVTYRGSDAPGMSFSVPGMPSSESSIFGSADITPNNSTDLARVTRGIYLGTGGGLKVMLVDGSTCDYPNLAAGIVHPIAAKRIYATGQTGTIASAIRAQY